MRTHGVPNFPDPGSSIGGPYDSIGGIEIPTTIDTQSPAFEAAQNSCHGLLSAALSPQGKPAITATLKAALIAQAECMRTHGVPGYQDPNRSDRNSLAPDGQLAERPGDELLSDGQ